MMGMHTPSFLLATRERRGFAAIKVVGRVLFLRALPGLSKEALPDVSQFL
jgi:hypothetical protein